MVCSKVGANTGTRPGWALSVAVFLITDGLSLKDSFILSFLMLVPYLLFILTPFFIVLSSKGRKSWKFFWKTRKWYLLPQEVLLGLHRKTEPCSIRPHILPLSGYLPSIPRESRQPFSLFSVVDSSILVHTAEIKGARSSLFIVEIKHKLRDHGEQGKSQGDCHSLNNKCPP